MQILLLKENSLLKQKLYIPGLTIYHLKFLKKGYKNNLILSGVFFDKAVSYALMRSLRGSHLFRLIKLAEGELKFFNLN